MEKVISINDWWDGPLLGLAYYHENVCIYEKVFSESQDEYIDEYVLYPINNEEVIAIISEYKEWCNAVSLGELNLFYKTHQYSNMKITKIKENNLQNKHYRKKARFKGTCDKGYIPIDYYVEWYD